MTMIKCPNSECRQNIQRETSLFCPYCGIPIANYGGVYSDWHNFDFSLINYKQIDRINPPTMLIKSLDTNINKVLVWADRLVFRSGRELSIVNIVDSLNSNDLVIMKEIRDEILDFCIVKPFVFYISSDKLRWTHLGTGKEMGEIDLTANRMKDFLDDEMHMVPFENIDFIKRRRQNILLLITKSYIYSLHLGADESAHRHKEAIFHHGLDRKICFVSISSARVLQIYSEDGHFVRFPLSDIFSDQRTSPVRPMVEAAELPAHYSLEWGCQLGDNLMIFRRHRDNIPDLVFRKGKMEKVIGSKSILKRRPLIDNDNLLTYCVMDLDNRIAKFSSEYELIQYPADFIKPLGQQPGGFTVALQNLYLYNGRLFGLFPEKSNDETSDKVSFSLSMIEFYDNHYSLGLQQWRIPNISLKGDNSKLVTPPLLCSNSRAVSYMENHLIIMSLNGGA